MKSRILVALAVVAALGFGSLALAADETLSGKVTCAKCTLKKTGVKDCADVLVLAGAEGTTTEYWIVKNPVLEKFGHQCVARVRRR